MESGAYATYDVLTLMYIQWETGKTLLDIFSPSEKILNISIDYCRKVHNFFLLFSNLPQYRPFVLAVI